MTAVAGRSTTRAPSAYVELAQNIRDEGLLGRCYVHYWRRILVTVGAFAGIWVGVVLVGESWFQLLLAGALGVVVSQVGFLSHEAAHRQIFKSAAWNDWTARLLGGLLAGLSVGWWRGKHNRHHAAPNQEGRDPDVAPGLIAFTGEIAASRTTGLAGWFTRHQGWLLLPLLTLEGLGLHVSSLRRAFDPEPLAYRRTEAALVLLRLVVFVVVLVLLLGPGIAAAFIGVQLAVFGLGVGGAFVPNHTAMPIVPRDARMDFLDRQVLMSRNIRGGAWMSFLMGGLNLQIEHHLFPSMARPHLRRAQPIVRAYCADRSITYTETGLVESYRIIIDYLNHVGLRARRPFQCPLAAADLRI